ncbi:glycosyltransferase [Candidatus Woesearchaeota archaeon]|nr:glycosyltransferase [Candidatus Woesearchaeota archaeon]
MKKVHILLPCFNEADSIGQLIDHIREFAAKGMYYVTITVIDNNSTDATRAIAREKGVKVIDERRQGKGFAMVSGFRSVSKSTDYVVMLDGDGSYDITELPRMLEPLDSDFADVIVGTRLQGRINENALPALNRVGNWLFTFITRVGYQTNVTDVCSGYFAWKAEVVHTIADYIESKGFTLEMEMIAKMARIGFSCYSVPISYHPREGHSSLHPLKDGLRILRAWARYLFWVPHKVSRTHELHLHESV